MNLENLHELINRYEENLDMLYGNSHDELFKWKAMKTWRNEWYKSKNDFSSFAERYSASVRDFGLFIDNSRMHPSSGLIKLWEKEPKAVENLFCDVLLAETNGDISAVQANIDNFVVGYNDLLLESFPKNWSFKQDRHTASVFIAMNNPDSNFVFKSSEAHTMANYIDFVYPIGTGENFNLQNYYKLCEEIVSALKEHDGLLKKHFERLTDEYYNDKTLHLLAFDLMYCCRNYNFYKGLIPPSVRRRIQRKPVRPQLTPEEIEQREKERLAKIEEIEQKIVDLEVSCDEYSDISLIGVEVTSDKYGLGTVISQKINKIKVQFENSQISFVLDKKYLMRPRFENDEIIVEAFTEYGKKQEEIEKLKRELGNLQL